MGNLKKKYIAGTVCPKCNKIDSIRFWEENQTCFKECVSCDYQEKMQQSHHKINQPINIKIKTF